MADKRKILELDIDVESIITKSVTLKIELDKLRASNAELAKTVGGTSSEAFVKNAAAISKVSGEYNTNQKQLANLAQAGGVYLTALEKVNLSLNKEVMGIAEARINNTELLKIRNELNLKTVEGAKSAGLINEKIDQNNKLIKDNVSAQEKQVIGIGDYKTGITAALKESGLFNFEMGKMGSVGAAFSGILTKLKEDLAGVVASTKASVAETEGMTGAQKASTISTALSSGALNIFKIALAGTGVGLLVIGLGALIAYLTTTGEGMKKVNLILQPLKAMFAATMSIVTNLGRELFLAFENPKKAMSSLADFVKQNLINRFTAFATILDGIIHLDFKKVTTGVLQAGTGIVDLTGKLSNIASKTANFLGDAAKKGSEIAKINSQITKEQLKYNAHQADFTAEIQKQQEISKLTSNSFAQRGAAAKEIIKLTTDNAIAEAHILKLSQQKLGIEQSIKGIANLTKADKFEAIEAEDKVRAAERKGVEVKIEQSRILGGMIKEQRAQNAKAAADTTAENKKLADEKLAELKKQQDEAIKNAEFELTLFLKTSKTLLDGKKFIDTKLVNEELERINKVSEAQATAATVKLVNGKLTTEEYNNVIKLIDLDYAQSKLDAEQKAFDTGIARDALNLQLKRDIADLESASDYETAKAKEEARYEDELKAAEKNFADKDLIKKKHLDIQSNMDKIKHQSELDLLSKNLGIAAGLLSEHTLLYKALTIAQIGINTHKNAVQAYADGLEIGGPAGLIAAPVFAGLAIAQGVMSAAKVAGVKFEQGGMLQGNSHSNGGIPFTVNGKSGFEAEGGEAIINKNSTSMYGHLLSAINVAGGGVAFAGGGIPYPSMTSSTTTNQNTMIIDYDLLASKISQANKSLPAPRLAIDEFHSANNDYVDIRNGANF